MDFNILLSHIGYDDRLTKFAFQVGWVKVKEVTLLFLEKHCHRSSDSTYKPISM